MDVYLPLNSATLFLLSYALFQLFKLAPPMYAHTHNKMHTYIIDARTGKQPSEDQLHALDWWLAGNWSPTQ